MRIFKGRLLNSICFFLILVICRAVAFDATITPQGEARVTFCRGMAQKSRPDARRPQAGVEHMDSPLGERVLPAPTYGWWVMKRSRARRQCGEIPLDRSQYSRATAATVVVAEKKWRARPIGALKHKPTSFKSSPVSRAGHSSSTISREPQTWPAPCVRPTRLADWLADCARHRPLHHIYQTASTKKIEQPSSHSFTPAATEARRRRDNACRPLDRFA